MENKENAPENKEGLELDEAKTVELTSSLIRRRFSLSS
jgi:hypothetical protein